MAHEKKYFVYESPENTGRRILTYARGTSRRVHHLGSKKSKEETPPHGAGSFHNPEHHQNLMDRVDDYLRDIDKT